LALCDKALDDGGLAAVPGHDDDRRLGIGRDDAEDPKADDAEGHGVPHKRPSP